ncbi:MAG: hypothetical protein JRJ84_22900, partial [Deltaproteobacteria bacterium]|nr:hypothetical protein [Deltaproteobacteria bacterium]
MTNEQPTAEITQPLDGADLVAGVPVTLSGTVSDPDHTDDQLVTRWTGNGNVLCPEAAPNAGGLTGCEATLDETITEITLTVVDPEEAVGTDQIGVVVRSSNPPT